MICISTFPAGFESAIEHALRRNNKSIRVKKVYSGLVVYEYHGDMEALARLDCVSNTFLALKDFYGKTWTFPRMVQEVAEARIRYPNPSTDKAQTFRVRFSQANQFEHVDPTLVKAAEQLIERGTGQQSRREGADAEYWYILRSEGLGFYARLISPGMERAPQRGELRQSFAALMVHWARFAEDVVVLDPCAGSGSLCAQVLRIHPQARVIAADIEKARVTFLRKRLPENRATVMQMNVRDMTALADQSVDAVLSDPPWGLFEAMDDLGAFYVDMAREMARVLRPGGMMVLLTARGDLLTVAAKAAGLETFRAEDTLVNGKKASLYMLRHKPVVAES